MTNKKRDRILEQNEELMRIVEHLCDELSDSREYMVDLLKRIGYLEGKQELVESNKNPWSRIETAPKDGTPILVSYSLDKSGKPINTGNVFGLYCQVAYWKADLSADGYWISYNKKIVGEQIRLGFEPTHWMPLPKPPNVDEI